MKSLVMCALDIFKDKCFFKIVDNLRKAIFVQLIRYGNRELIDLEYLKSCISAFV